MIVLCPKAFSSNDGLRQEREFLKYFLSRKGEKGIIANEVWETFRFNLIENNSEDKADQTIADWRGIFEPEETKIGEDFREIPPTGKHTLDQLMEKTEDLLRRRWADIDLFITTNGERFQKVVEEKGIEMVPLQEFLFSSMEDQRSRNIMVDFWEKIQSEKWD